MLINTVLCSNLEEKDINGIVDELSKYGFSLADENYFYIKGINYKSDHECLLLHSDGTGQYEIKTFHSKEPFNKFFKHKNSKKKLNKIACYRFQNNQIVKYKKSYLPIEEVFQILNNQEIQQIKYSELSMSKKYDSKLQFLTNLQLNIFDNWENLKKQKSDFFVPKSGQDEVEDLIKKNNFTYIYMQNNDQDVLQYSKFQFLNDNEIQNNPFEYVQLQEEKPKISNLTQFICEQANCYPINNRYIIDKSTNEIYTIHFGGNHKSYNCFITKIIDGKKVIDITDKIWELCKENAPQQIMQELYLNYEKTDARLKLNSGKIQHLKQKIEQLNFKKKDFNIFQEEKFNNYFELLNNLNIKLDIGTFYFHLMKNKNILVFQNGKYQENYIQDKYDQKVSLNYFKIGQDSQLYLFTKCFPGKNLTKDWILKAINTTQSKIYNHLIKVQKNLKFRLHVPTGNPITKGFDICLFPEIRDDDSKFSKKKMQSQIFKDLSEEQKQKNIEEILNFNNLEFREPINEEEKFLCKKISKLQQLECFIPKGTCSINSNIFLKNKENGLIYKAFYLPDEWIQFNKGKKSLFGNVKLYILDQNGEDSSLIIKNLFLQNKYAQRLQKTQKYLGFYKQQIDIFNQKNIEEEDYENNINNKTLESISVNQSSCETLDNNQINSASTLNKLKSKKSSLLSDDSRLLNIKINPILFEFNNEQTDEFIDANQDKLLEINPINHQNIQPQQGAKKIYGYLQKFSGYIFAIGFAILVVGTTIFYNTSPKTNESNVNNSETSKSSRRL